MTDRDIRDRVYQLGALWGHYMLLAARPDPVRPPAPRIDSPYLTIEEAAEYCRVAKQTLYNHRRHIARQPGVSKLLFTRESLDNWLCTRRRPR